MIKRNFKRLVVISDLHCGHLIGLTPPDWHYNWDTKNKTQKKIAIHQKELWEWYAARIDELKPINFIIVNGDAIDGKGLKSGSTEAITAARNRQCEMAAFCIDYAGAEECGLTHGTAYHDGGEEDWACVTASLMKTPTMFVEGHAFFTITGPSGQYKRNLDIKHFISRSTIPHGQATPAIRAGLWNIMWNSRKNKDGEGQQQKAHILIRSHVHYHLEVYSGAVDCRCYITPALQGYGSKYGARMCENTVDIGFLVFDIYDDGYQSKCIKATNLSQQTVEVITR